TCLRTTSTSGRRKCSGDADEGGSHIAGGVLGSGCETPRSSTNFHDPSGCCFQIVMKFPNAAGFASLMSFLYCHGPVVYPRSPAREIAAKIGCHVSSGRVVAGGSGCCCIHSFPLTARGRKRIP